LTISDRSLVAKIAAHERWAREPDRTAATAPARQANADRYLNAVRALNPNLSEDELRMRAANLRSADMTRLARARWSGPSTEKKSVPAATAETLQEGRDASANRHQSE
jgi:hypothetical protein